MNGRPRPHPEAPPAVAAAAFGVVRLAPLVYTPNRDDNLARNAVSRAAEREGLKNALVWLETDMGQRFDLRDLTRNLPVGLYPEQDVVYAIEGDLADRQCVSRMFPARRQYHTVGSTDVTFVDEEGLEIWIPPATPHPTSP
jgi:hypothetical protein